MIMIKHLLLKKNKVIAGDSLHNWINKKCLSKNRNVEEKNFPGMTSENLINENQIKKPQIILSFMLVQMIFSMK